MVPAAMPSALTNASSTSGRCCASIFFIVTRKSASLPATSLLPVVGRELQREGLGLPDLHAAHGLVELLEHLAFADDELARLRPCRRRSLAVDLALEVDRHAVAFGRALAGRALRKRAPLLAQDVDRAVDRRIVDVAANPLDLGLQQMSPSLTSG